MSAPRLAPIKQAALVAPRPVQDTPWSTDFCPANNIIIYVYLYIYFANNIVCFNANLTTSLLNYQDSNTPFEKKYLFSMGSTNYVFRGSILLGNQIQSNLFQNHLWTTSTCLQWPAWSPIFPKLIAVL